MILNIKQSAFICLFFFVLSLFMFSRDLGSHGVEYRDDEIFYYKSTQEMVATGNYLSPKYFGENRFQKPVLYYWFILIAYKMFGMGWFAARSVAVLFAAATVVVTWLIAQGLFGDRKISNLSALILMTVPLFFRHAKNAVPDMPLTFFIVFAMFCIMKFCQKPDAWRYRILFFVSCGLGFMVKGLAALAVPMLSLILYAIWSKKGEILKKINFPVGILIIVLLGAPWFIYMMQTHGSSYFDYMVMDETKERLIGKYNEAFIIAKSKEIIARALFYIETLLSYFAPWSLFFLLGLPVFWRKVKKQSSEQDNFKFLISWFIVVFVIFSCMYYKISHYILVLSTPFAILTSFFFLAPLNKEKILDKIIGGVRRYGIFAICFLVAFVYTFIVVFMAQATLWKSLYLMTFVAIVIIGVIRGRRLFVAPTILAVFILFVMSQTGIIAQAGLVGHATLQKFAKTVHADEQKDFLLSVGSHDIHEKEFQVYFEDIKLEQLAHGYEPFTKKNLDNFFANDQKLYCLMIEKDYDKYLKPKNIEGLIIVQEEYMARKRMHLDGDFLKAVLTFDRATVYDYLMEKIVLIRKENDV